MELEDLGKEVVQRLRDAGHVALFAGGCVRDRIIGEPFDDIDIATDATPEEVIALFSHTVPVGKAFGVVLVIHKDTPFEIASFRADGLYVDGRRPEEVTFSTPEKDAQRRDFTVNGLFYDPISDEILDYVGGQEDLQKKIVRAIGDPKQRFAEDRLRMIRGVRLAARLNFEIEQRTREAIQEFADQLFPAVAVERVWQELQKIGNSAGFDRALLDLHRLGLLVQIIPQSTDIDVERSLAPLQHYHPATPAVIKLSPLIAHLSEEDQLALCESLRVANEDIKWLEFLQWGRELSVCDEEDAPDFPWVDWLYFYADERSPVILAALSAALPDEKRLGWMEKHLDRQHRWERPLYRIAHRCPIIDGHTLMREGITPGKELGDLLKEAERITLQCGIEEPHLILERLRYLPLWKEAGGR